MVFVAWRPGVLSLYPQLKSHRFQIENGGFSNFLTTFIVLLKLTWGV